MILGIDTSRWEDNAATAQTIDWNKVKSAGAEFVIMKATEGAAYVDPVYALHKANSAGILYRGSYHFWRANHDIKIQAANYFKVAGVTDMPPILDVEDWYGDLPKGAVLESKILAMLAEIDRVFGRECMIYTSPNIIKYYLALTPSSPFCRRKLWIANYGVTAPVITPFPRWSIWQFSETGNAAKYGINEASSVDENWYNGTIEDFRSEFGITAPEPEPKPEPVVKILSVKQDNAPVSGLLSISYSVDGGAVKSQVIDQRAPEPPKRVYFRVIDDIELQRDPIRNGDPATRRIWGGKGSVPLTPSWMAFAYELNKPKTGYQFIDKNTLKPFVGWRNRGDINVVEQVAFAGNIVEADIDADGNYEFTHIKYGACVYIKSLSNEAVAPAGVIMPPGPTNLPLIHNFSIQWKDRLDLSTDGRWCRILIIRNPGERLFMEKRFLSKM